MRRAGKGLVTIASRRHTVAVPRSATQHRSRKCHHTPKRKHHHNLQVPPQTRASAQSRMREYELHLWAGEVGAAHAKRRRRRVWLWPAR